MQTTAHRSDADLTARIAAAPQADATQQHLTDEVNHPEVEEAFYSLPLRPATAMQRAA